MTTVPKFETNELVDVAIRAARIRAVDDQGVLYIGDNDELMIDPAAPNITVTRVAPKEWPPRAGDIWEDRFDDEWVTTDSDGETILMDCIGGSRHNDALDVLNDVGPLKLVRRRGWTPAPEAPADEPAEVDERAGYIAGLGALIDLMKTLPVGYVSDVILQPGDLAGVQAWADAFGVEVTEALLDNGKVTHHRAESSLGGLKVTVLWADYHKERPASRPVLELAEDDDQTAADAEQVLATVAEPTAEVPPTFAQHATMPKPPTGNVIKAGRIT